MRPAFSRVFCGTRREGGGEEGETSTTSVREEGVCRRAVTVARPAGDRLLLLLLLLLSLLLPVLQAGSRSCRPHRQLQCVARLRGGRPMAFKFDFGGDGGAAVGASDAGGFKFNFGADEDEAALPQDAAKAFDFDKYRNTPDGMVKARSVMRVTVSLFPPCPPPLYPRWLSTKMPTAPCASLRADAGPAADVPDALQGNAPGL
jgi:hypothetical protein